MNVTHGNQLVGFFVLVKKQKQKQKQKTKTSS